MGYDGGWRNRLRFLYCQYLYLEDVERNFPKLFQILKKYGRAFDDVWQYRIRGRSKKIVTRFPLWMKTERDYSEKARELRGGK